MPTNSTQNIISQPSFFHNINNNKTNLSGIQHPIIYAPQKLVGVTKMPEAINAENHSTQAHAQASTNIGINYGLPCGNIPTTNNNNMRNIGTATHNLESTVINEHKTRFLIKFFFK